MSRPDPRLPSPRRVLDPELQARIEMASELFGGPVFAETAPDGRTVGLAWHAPSGTMITLTAPDAAGALAALSLFAHHQSHLSEELTDGFVQ